MGERTREEEYGIIGCLLIDPECLADVYSFLKPEMFTVKLASETYRTILGLFDFGENINVVTITNKLESYEYTRDTIGAFLKSCLTVTQTSAMAKNYANTILQEYKAREVKKVLNAVSLIPGQIDVSIGQIIGRLEQLQHNRKIVIQSYSQMVSDNRDNYFCEKEDKSIKSGFYKLDCLIGGFEGGNIYVIGARPAVGKSAFAVQMINQMAERGNRVCYYNLEMTPKQVFERDVCQMGSIRMDRLKNGKNFLGDEKENYNKALAKMETLPVDIISGAVSLSDLKQTVKHQKYDIIVIDYLQLLNSEKNYANRASEVGYISKMLKGISLELNVPIVVLSQLNRSSEQRETKEPTMSELRESGDIEQDATAIILLWNLTEDKRNKGLKIDKNRQGECGKIAYRFRGENTKFEEMQEEFKTYLYMIGEAEKAAKDLNSFCDAEGDTPFA